MKLHPDLRPRLLDITINSLSQLQVDKGRYLHSADADFLVDGDKALGDKVNDN
jgi:hypothetical protein